MDFRITDIKNFVATTSCRTIIEAAAKLEISQPALSESLKRLESDARTILFYRSRSGVQLTSSGRLFLEKAKKLLSSYNDLNLDQDPSRIFTERVISIGCHATVAQYSLPKAIKYLMSKAPDYQIALHHDLSRNIQMNVQRGVIDVGIVINPSTVPDLIIQKLDQDEVAVWSSTHAIESKTIICNTHLFQTQSILSKWKSHPSRIISTESLELICKLTHENIGYGILPTKAVEQSKLKLTKLSHLPHYKDTIALVYRPEFGKHLAEKITLDAIRFSLK